MEFINADITLNLARLSVDGDVGLAALDYATDLPWDALACSPEPETRRLTAVLIPWLTDVDADPISQLAGDGQTSVRRELAISIAT